MKRWSFAALGLFAALSPLLGQSAEPLIVVEDRGGDSALPYYAVLKPQHHATTTSSKVPSPGHNRFGEADMLPVHSARLSPGNELPRTITAPGLTPLFLVGDDDRSRAWLRNNAGNILKINSVGFIVNVETLNSLMALRALAPGLTLAPVSGDDFAERLHLRHYPVLITATAIEQ